MWQRIRSVFWFKNSQEYPVSPTLAALPAIYLSLFVLVLRKSHTFAASIAARLPLVTHRHVPAIAKRLIDGLAGIVAPFLDATLGEHISLYFLSCWSHQHLPRIKRRSAFTAHLKRHRIDPVTLDVDSLAPPLLPASVPVPRRRSIGQLVSYDIKPKIEDLSPTRLHQARKDYYHHVQHLCKYFPLSSSMLLLRYGAI